jgi:hypothetical protein
VNSSPTKATTTPAITHPGLRTLMISLISPVCESSQHAPDEDPPKVRCCRQLLTRRDQRPGSPGHFSPQETNPR